MGPQPTRLGFGVSGAHGTPLLPRDQTLALIEAALEGGIRTFDTAPSYGAGEAETRLGLAMARFGRARFHVSTKAGLKSSGLVKRDRDFSPDFIETSLVASASRLGLADPIDTAFLHGPDPRELSDALFNRLDGLRRDGLFRELGVAGRGAELDFALQTGQFRVLMMPVHAFMSPVEEARLQAARAAGLRIIAIETGGPGRPPVRSPERLADLYALGKAVRGRLQGVGMRSTPVEEGLEAALAREDVDQVLFTTTRLSHLQQNLRLLTPNRLDPWTASVRSDKPDC